MRKLFEIFKVWKFQKKNSCRGNYIRKFGTPQPGLQGIYLIVTLIEALQPSFVVIAVLNFQCTAWACSTSRNSDSTIRIIDDQMSLSSFLSTVLCGFIIRIVTHNAVNLRKDISNSRTFTKGLDFYSYIFA